MFIEDLDKINHLFLIMLIIQINKKENGKLLDLLTKNFLVLIIQVKDAYINFQVP